MMMLYTPILLVILSQTATGNDADYYERLYKSGQLRYQGVWDDVNKRYYEFLDRIISVQTSPPLIDVVRLSNLSFSIVDWCGDLLFNDLSDKPGVSQALDELLFQDKESNNINLYCDKPDNLATHTVNISYSNGRSAPVDTPAMNCHCAVHNITLTTVNNMITGQHLVSFKPCNTNRFTKYVQEETGKELDFIRGLYLEFLPIYELGASFLRRFPNLEVITLGNLPLGNNGFPQHLLCSSTKLKIFHFRSSFGNLREFPGQIFNCMTQLSITDIAFLDHDFTYLPDHAFGSAATHLEYLHFNNVGLEFIEPLAFHGMASLQYLRLEHSNLQQMSWIWLPTATHMQIFYLFEVCIAFPLNLSSVLTSQGQHLDVFYFVDSNVTEITGQFCSKDLDSTLQYIDLCCNMLQVLPFNLFHYCSSLRYLDLNTNNLQYLDDELFSANVYNIEALDVSNNYLRNNVSWSTLLHNQTRLVHLNISLNMLTTWTHNLTNLLKLKQLDLSWNELRFVSQNAFEHMPKLEFLNLEGNYLQIFDVSTQSTSLSALLLSENGLSKISQGILTDSLQILDVSQNNISSLVIPVKQQYHQCEDTSVYAQMNSLMNFSLSCTHAQQYSLVNVSCNNLTDFYGIFPDAKINPCKIESLDISRNPLDNFWEDENFDEYLLKCSYFEYTTHTIGSLNMQYCNIQILYKTAFIYFTITFLDLQNNHLFYLMEMDMPYPMTIDLQNTHLNCRCSVLWLKKHLSQQTNSSKVQYQASQCTEILSQQTVHIENVLDVMFLCPTLCPDAIVEECMSPFCYSNTIFQNELDAVVCTAKNKQSILSTAFIQISSSLQLSGFYLRVLKLPYHQPSHLVYLNATECGIETLPDDAFAFTLDLKYLVLATNKIHSISALTFKSLIWLEIIDLSGNELASFHGDIIQHLRLLHTINLHSNRLSTLDTDTLQNMRTIRHISLYDNPWLCECNSSLPHWIFQQEDSLLQPIEIHCNYTGIPVMFANTTCDPDVVYITQQHHLSVALTSSLAVLLALCLVGGILAYKNHFFLSVLAHTYLPFCPCYAQAEGSGEVGMFAIYDDKAREAYMWIKDELIPHMEPRMSYRLL